MVVPLGQVTAMAPRCILDRLSKAWRPLNRAEAPLLVLGLLSRVVRGVMSAGQRRMVRAYAATRLAVMPVHLVLAVLALDVAAMLALVAMNLAAVLRSDRPALLLGLFLDLGVAAGFHDLAAAGLVVLMVSLATTLETVARVVRGAPVLVSSASHREGPPLLVELRLPKQGHSI